MRDVHFGSGFGSVVVVAVVLLFVSVIVFIGWAATRNSHSGDDRGR